VLAVDEGALQRQVDEAGGDAVLPDRDLPQHKRQAAGRLQHGDDVADRRVGLVDLVEEQEMRDLPLLELFHDQLQGGELLFVRFADHHRRIADGERRLALLLEFDGAGTVDEGEGVVQEGDVREIAFRAHPVIARFGRRIADSRAACHRALPLNGAGSRKNSFE
jgi:hypothetical protein